jgi:hypothetical protein
MALVGTSALRQRLHHPVGRQAEREQALRVDAHHHRSLAAPEGGRRRDSLDRREHRPHLEQGLVLDLADRLRLA